MAINLEFIGMDNYIKKVNGKQFKNKISSLKVVLKIYFFDEVLPTSNKGGDNDVSHDFENRLYIELLAYFIF